MVVAAVVLVQPVRQGLVEEVVERVVLGYRQP
jgi:hypothetical protein